MSQPTTPPYEQLTEEVRELRKLVDARLADDPIREQAFDKLYGELKQYKERFLQEAEKPLLLDLLQFYDSLTWFQNSLVKPEMSAEVVADGYQYLIDEFLELLYRRDVVPMDSKARFDRTTQRAVSVKAAEQPEDDALVDRVVKRGFLRDTRTLRAEEVVVLRWKKRGGNDAR